MNYFGKYRGPPFFIEEFEIADAEAHRQWEDLLGFPIQTDRIRMPRETYRKLYQQIHAIQANAALRAKNNC